MNDILLSTAAILASYVLGSVPTGLWLGLRFRGIDIREHGSRNIGATNTMRVLGKGLGGAALAADILKGWVPVVLFAQAAAWPYLPLACGVAAILGHSFSLFLGFKGGKGVATSTGVFLGLLPIPTLIAAVVFGVVLAATRMVSAGSISAAVALCIAAFFVTESWVMRGIVALMAALVILKHRDNIKRILRGEENRI
jgi:glycerol-3-phosphate acyltransferase PlsY